MTLDDDDDVDRWYEIGEGLLSAYRVSKRRLRAAFDNRLSAPYAQAIVDSVVRCGFDQREQSRRLGIHRTTSRRQEKNATLASCATIAALVNLFELEIDELTLPDHVDVALSAIRETVEECQSILKNENRSFSTTELVQIKMTLESEEWYLAVCDDTKYGDVTRRHVAATIACVAAQLTTSPGMAMALSEFEYQRFVQLIADWGEAYSMFLVSVPYKWGW